MLKSVVMAISLIIYSPVAAVAMSQGCGGKCSGCHSLTVAEADKLVGKIGVKVKKVAVASVRGLFELTVEKDGQQSVTYMDFGKKHIIPGPIYSLATQKPITAAPANKPKVVNKINVDNIPKGNSIVMGNPSGKKKLFVFTDPDCPYCKKLHAEIKKLVALDKNLTVYIKMLPLKMHPKAYDKAVAILGSPTAEMLDRAFSGAELAAGPAGARRGVDETIRYAESIGVTMTPSLVLSDGRVIPGYWDAPTIRKFLSGKTI